MLKTPARALLYAFAALSMMSLSGCFGLGGDMFARRETNEKQCLIRAMYFESNRSSEDGMYAVGTVVMNRVADRRYPKTICAVVGQKNQFAAGVLTRKMTEQRSYALAARVAEHILSGARHPGVRNAQHFHQAGLRFPYNNMHYVLLAGGNEFYEKY
jgi:spore germination cell wall hydrolase CwlJ-like protein